MRVFKYKVHKLHQRYILVLFQIFRLVLSYADRVLIIATRTGNDEQQLFAQSFDYHAVFLTVYTDC